MRLFTNDKSPIEFLVDDEDVERVSGLRWHLYSKYIQTRQLPRCYLHQFIMGMAPKGLEWDHKNRDKSDNRKNNLRLVTSSINKRNILRKDNPLGYPGIRLSSTGLYFAYIVENKKQIRLGLYKTLEEAIIVRKSVEQKFFPEKS